jgi:sporulation protein YlmC with PRC-barrel domain
MRTQYSCHGRFFSIVALAALGVSSASGQDSGSDHASRSSDGHAGATLSEELTDRDARVSRLIGQRVKSPRGEDLGEIEDLIAAPGREDTPTVVLSIGGALDVGDKWYATSLDELQVAADGDGLVLDTTQEQLAAAPAFDYQPRMGERSGQAGVRGPDTLNSIGRLLGAMLIDESGETLGEVEDLVVSTGSAGTRAVVAEGGVAGVGERLVTIPFEQLHIDRSGEEAAGIVQQPRVRVELDDTVLAALPKYEYPEDFPN